MSGAAIIIQCWFEAGYHFKNEQLQFFLSETERFLGALHPQLLDRGINVVIANLRLNENSEGLNGLRLSI